MNLSKAFDGQALLQALKEKGLADAEKLLEDDILKVLFDWLNASVLLESADHPLYVMAVPVLQILEDKALSQIKLLLESKIN